MRLALLMHSVLPRGGVVHTLELAEALAARGHAVGVVAPVEPGQALFRPIRVPFVPLPMPAVHGTLVEQVHQRIDAIVRALPAALAGRDVELLHAQDSLNGNALATLAEAGAIDVPWVRTVHHLDDFGSPELRRLQQRGWQAAHAIGCISALWCEHFRERLGVPAERLHNGVNLERFTPHGPRIGGAPYVLSLGGVEARKNTPRLLEAFARLHRDDPDWHGMRLVIAGGASLLDHREARAAWAMRLEACGLSEGPGQPVERIGPVADATLAPLMRGARLLAMPSLLEGFGLVALEALACGTPVLVSQRPPFTEHLSGCPQVAWCDPEDTASIAAGLREAARLPRAQTPPAVCIEHGWARSAAVHEAWYARIRARHAACCCPS